MRFRPLLWSLVAAGLVLVATLLVASRGGSSEPSGSSTAVESTPEQPSIRPVGSTERPGADPASDPAQDADVAPVVKSVGRDRAVPVPAFRITAPGETRPLEGQSRPADVWDAEELELEEGEEYRDPEWEWPEDEQLPE